METQLRVIPHHHIHMECRFCKHTADVAVKVLLEKYDVQPQSVTSFEKRSVKIVIENQNRISD